MKADNSIPRIGDAIEVAIRDLAVGGEGVGRDAAGRVFFVAATAPGDRVRARVTELRKRHGRAEVEAFLEASPDRVEPRCPVFGECGGCTWQHLSYSTQVAAKLQFLRDALVRIGRARELPEIEFVASPKPWAYRARARLGCAGHRVGFRKRHSHEICAIRGCPLLVAPLSERLATLAAQRDAAPAASLELELTAGADGVVRCVERGVAQPAPSSLHERLEIAVAGDRFWVSPGVFVQANALLLPRLVDEVARAAGTGAAALELYAGAGFFSLPLGRRFARLVCVEASASACRDLRDNLARAGVGGVDVVCTSVTPARLRGWLREHEPEVAVLDPPRAGLGRAGAGELAAGVGKRIVYLACDPASWGRDVGVLCAEGWQLRRVIGFDLFPQTSHVEALAVLERDSPTT